MQCLDENGVVDYLDGRLSPTRRSEVESHLSTCAACRRVVTEVRTGPTPDHDASEPTDVPSELGRQRLIGRYRIERVIGRGGMGTIYEAVDPELERSVAIKVWRVDGASADSASSTGARLLREARALAQLDHPNVVAVHDVGTVGDDGVFIAMDLIEGQTVRRWLREANPSVPEIIEIFLGAGQGLAAAHRAGFVHRDFKPSNVLVDQDRRVRVVDFGLVRTVESASTDADSFAEVTDPEDPLVTQTGMVLGTPAYMAPEQHAGEVADARSDQFSYCVSLYEALYGSRPFAGSTLAEVRSAVLGNVRAAPVPRAASPKRSSVCSSADFSAIRATDLRRWTRSLRSLPATRRRGVDAGRPR